MTDMTWNSSQTADALHVAVVGIINEVSDLKALAAEIDAKRPRELVFDLGGIHRINSCGVREWVDFMRQVDSLGIPTVFERCSVAVVPQLNTIWGFAGAAAIASVVAPYFCESCAAPHEELVSTREADPSTLGVDIPCPACRGVMTFDDIPEVYFRFAASK